MKPRPPRIHFPSAARSESADHFFRGRTKRAHFLTRRPRATGTVSSLSNPPCNRHSCSAIFCRSHLPGRSSPTRSTGAVTYKRVHHTAPSVDDSRGRSCRGQCHFRVVHNFTLVSGVHFTSPATFALICAPIQHTLLKYEPLAAISHPYIMGK